MYRSIWVPVQRNKTFRQDEGGTAVGYATLLICIWKHPIKRVASVFVEGAPYRKRTKSQSLSQFEINLKLIPEIIIPRAGEDFRKDTPGDISIPHKLDS